MPPKKPLDTRSVLKDSSAPQSLQALQFGIDSLSLDQALAAVSLAKLKIDDLKDQQKIALSLVISASKAVEEAETRLV